MAAGVAFATPWSGQPVVPQDNLFAGGHIVARRDTSNAEDYEMRYAELGANLAAIGIFGLDIGNTAAYHFFGPNVANMGPAERMSEITRRTDVAAGDAGNAVVSGLMSLYDNANNAANDQRRVERAGRLGRAESDTAWDLREQLMQEEEERRNQRNHNGGFFWGTN